MIVGNAGMTRIGLVASGVLRKGSVAGVTRRQW
jgi:hypothetical protein